MLYVFIYWQEKYKKCVIYIYCVIIQYFGDELCLFMVKVQDSGSYFMEMKLEGVGVDVGGIKREECEIGCLII